MTKYAVMTDTLFQGWVNCWQEDDKPLTFETIEEAQAEINEYIADVVEAINDGDMEGDIDCVGEDLRIMDISTGEFVG